MSPWCCWCYMCHQGKYLPYWSRETLLRRDETKGEIPIKAQCIHMHDINIVLKFSKLNFHWLLLVSSSHLFLLVWFLVDIINFIQVDELIPVGAACVIVVTRCNTYLKFLLNLLKVSLNKGTNMTIVEALSNSLDNEKLCCFRER